MNRAASFIFTVVIGMCHGVRRDVQRDIPLLQQTKSGFDAYRIGPGGRRLSGDSLLGVAT